MEADRKLLNPFFEGYKLSFDESPLTDYFPLKFKVLNNREEGADNLTDLVTDFQLLADKIYENKLKSTKNALYYISQDEECYACGCNCSCDRICGDIVMFSKETLNSTVIEGPFETFNVTTDEEDGTDHIFALQEGKLFIISAEGSKEFINVEFPSDEQIKILKMRAKNGSIITVLQSVTRDQEDDKPIFKFYRVIWKSDLGSSCELLGKSKSRSLVSLINDTNSVFIGTSTGIVTDSDNCIGDASRKDESCGESGGESVNVLNVFDVDEEIEEESGVEDCKIMEFKLNCDPVQYPEVTISGTSILDSHLAIKYLYDVIIYDLSTSKHVSTFPAMNFIQNGKIDKKFSVFGRSYAYLMETGGNVYCYAKPEHGDQKTSRQHLIELNEEILGWSHEFENEQEILMILTNEKIFKLTMK